MTAFTPDYLKGSVPPVLSSPVQHGDIVGFHFPTSNAEHPHPGLVIRVIEGEVRNNLLTRRGVADAPGSVLCMLLMISHAAPSRGEYGELIPLHHRTGTLLDTNRDLFICYRHFDAALVPGQERPIGSIRGPYLGRMSEAATRHYRDQLSAVQSYIKNRSFKLPDGLVAT